MKRTAATAGACGSEPPACGRKVKHSSEPPACTRKVMRNTCWYRQANMIDAEVF